MMAERGRSYSTQAGLIDETQFPGSWGLQTLRAVVRNGVRALPNAGCENPFSATDPGNGSRSPLRQPLLKPTQVL